jgi:hypothetical protein
MIVIRLSRGEWSYDPDLPLGPAGGFGVVYAGEGKDGKSVAVKRLNISAEDAAHRELRIAAELAGKSLAHVIPMYDEGEDAESGAYFVVMAKAERSLEQEIRARGKLDDAETVAVLLQITQGLSEVSQLIHRDLKPANVLLHEGVWKVADFGIARFAEDSTSLQTLKGCLSAPYAAPEQWRFERASAATDVYALGCIGHALLTGKPPFAGQDVEDFSRQHQHDEPPPLDGHDSRLRSLLAMMLRKTPDTRPGIGRVVTLLRSASDATSLGAGFAALGEAGAAVAEREAAHEAHASAVRTKAMTRDQIAREATRILRAITDDLFERIVAIAPTAKRIPNVRGVRLGAAELRITLLVSTLSDRAFPQSKWDVVTGATIVVRQANPRYEWSASLWYVRPKPDQDYRWYEVSYFVNTIWSERPRPEFEPFALTDNAPHADEAAAPGIGRFQIAWGPKTIDDEDAEDFCNRWAELLAKAAKGEIAHPRSLPLQ